MLVDNAAYSYAFQLDNGIPILPFYEARTLVECPGEVFGEIGRSGGCTSGQ